MEEGAVTTVPHLTAEVSFRVSVLNIHHPSQIYTCHFLNRQVSHQGIGAGTEALVVKGQHYYKTEGWLELLQS